MNIFVTDLNPTISALNLDSLRLNKMILESCQLLSTAIELTSEIKYTGLYKATHKNHPCAIWTRENDDNFFWLYQHTIALIDEFKFRKNKNHGCEKILPVVEKFMKDNAISEKTTKFPKKFANCTRNDNVSFKDMDDVVEAYRNYMKYKWKNDIRQPSWDNRQKPEWFVNE